MDTGQSLKRREWDSNPRYPCEHIGFQDQRLKPLGHLSSHDPTLSGGIFKVITPQKVAPLKADGILA